MRVSHPSEFQESLIPAACHAGGVGDCDSEGKVVRILRFPDSCHPAASVGLGSYAPEVSTGVYHIACDALLLQSLSRDLGCKTFAHRTQVNRRLGVRDPHGGVLLVYFQKLETHVLSGFLKSLFRRQVLGLRRSCLMPQGKDGSHCYVHLAACEFTEPLREKKHLYQPRIHLHRVLSGVEIDRAQIVHAIVLVVDVHHPVVVAQDVLHNYAVRLERNNVVTCIAADHGHGVEVGIQDTGLGLDLGLRTSCKKDNQNQRNQDGG